VAPKLSFALWSGENTTSLLQRYVYPLWAIRGRMRGYEVAVTKAAMDMLGATAGPVRPPLANLRPEDAADLRALVKTYRELA
jgi:5-dehydro-4-deoxyglucarate dehydratase